MTNMESILKGNELNNTNENLLNYNDGQNSETISSDSETTQKPNIKNYSNIEIKKIIDSFSEDQQIEIFKIIKYYNEFYSTNNNGIFINLDNISDSCKNEIISFISFSKHKNESLDRMENDLNIYKKIVEDTD